MAVVGRRQAASTVPVDDPAAGWQSTRSHTVLATQFIEDEDQYLGGSEPQRDIGRAVGRDDRELFVSCGAGEALAQQFEHLKTDFIAVHGIATRASQQLVGGIAAALGRPLHKLAIRRQGFGSVLATLHYAELARADGGTPVRIYATDGGPAGAAERHALARALLAHSRLGVLLLGEQPAAALADQLQRWRAELAHGGNWPNRQLLLLPLAADPGLADAMRELTRGSAVQVRSTPKVTRAADAWGFIHSAWAQLHGPLAGGPAAPAAGSQAAAAAAVTAAAMPSAAPGARLPAQSAAAAVVGSEPGPLSIGPRSGTTATGAAADEPLARYVKRVAELDGVASCCVFEAASGRELAHARSDPRWVELARHGSELLAAMTSAGARLGLRNGAVSQPEAAITLGTHHHLLLRPIPHRSGLALHAVLDTSSANLTLLRLRLERLDETMRA